MTALRHLYISVVLINMAFIYKD